MQIFFRHFAESRQQIDTGFYYSILHYLELPSPEFKATEEPLDTSVKVRNNKWTLFKHGYLELRKSWIKNHFEWFYVRMKNFEKRLVVGFISSSLLDHGMADIFFWRWVEYWSRARKLPFSRGKRPFTFFPSFGFVALVSKTTFFDRFRHMWGGPGLPTLPTFWAMTYGCILPSCFPLGLVTPTISRI